MKVRNALVVLGIVLIGTVRGSAEQDPEAAVRALVKQFYAAEQAYDQGALAKLITRDYVEVSPRGQVDAYDRFLGFYSKDQKTNWPPMTLSEEQLRIVGDAAIEIAQIEFTMKAPDGSTKPLKQRASFVAHRTEGVWKLIGAQYTTIWVPPASK